MQAYPFHCKGLGHSHVLVAETKTLPFKHGIHASPFQLSVGGHSQTPDAGFKNWPLKQLSTQVVPFHYLPAPQSMQELSLV